MIEKDIFCQISIFQWNPSWMVAEVICILSNQVSFLISASLDLVLMVSGLLQL